MDSLHVTCECNQARKTQNNSSIIDSETRRAGAWTAELATENSKTYIPLVFFGVASNQLNKNIFWHKLVSSAPACFQIVCLEVSGSDKEQHEAMINKQNPYQFLAMHIFLKEMLLRLLRVWKKRYILFYERIMWIGYCRRYQEKNISANDFCKIFRRCSKKCWNLSL